MNEMEAADPNRLNAKLEAARLEPLGQEQINQFNRYLDLILKWNARTNLTSVRERDEIIDRHFLECILCARILPANIGSLLDLGSGAGLPGIPIAICRPDLHVTLAESQNKKAAFLNEAVRTLRINTRVYAGRAEDMKLLFDAVTLRAVDKMPEAISLGIAQLRAKGMLVVMTSDSHEIEDASLKTVVWQSTVRVPGTKHRIICLGNRE